MEMRNACVFRSWSALVSSRGLRALHLLPRPLAYLAVPEICVEEIEAAAMARLRLLVSNGLGRLRNQRIREADHHLVQTETLPQLSISAPVAPNSAKPFSRPGATPCHPSSRLSGDPLTPYRRHSSRELPLQRLAVVNPATPTPNPEIGIHLRTVSLKDVAPRGTNRAPRQDQHSARWGGFELLLARLPGTPKAVHRKVYQKASKLFPPTPFRCYEHS